MSEITSANVDLITAVLNLADPRDTRHAQRIKALCERLGVYMQMNEQQSDERMSLAQDVLTLTRTMSMQAQRLHLAETTVVDQRKVMQELTRRIAHQTEQITALNATVIELIERLQQIEAEKLSSKL